MSHRLKVILAGICGVLGSAVLVVSFRINPAPPANDTVAQLTQFAIQHGFAITFGGWLQAVGTILTVLFAVPIVHFAGAARRLSGWITVIAAIAILIVSLLEITFYRTATQALLDGDASTGNVANSVIKSVQHVFLISPALLLPLGYVLVTSRVLPRVFGVTSLLTGAVLQVMGPVGMFRFIQPIVDVVLIVQAAWFIAAGIMVLIRTEMISAGLSAQ